MRAATLAICDVALLVSAGGVIAMLMPRAAKIYPVHCAAPVPGYRFEVRHILCAGLGALGFCGHFAWSAAPIAVPMAMSAVMLLRSGIETRGYGPEDIQASLAEPHRDGVRGRE